jgi:hypothetical protein
VLEGSLGIAAICEKEEVSSGPEHSVEQTVSHRHGRGDDYVETVGSARTDPVGTAGPLKARGFAEFGRRAPRPPTGGPSTGLDATDRWAAALDFPTHE